MNVQSPNLDKFHPIFDYFGHKKVLNNTLCYLRKETIWYDFFFQPLLRYIKLYKANLARVLKVRNLILSE